MDLPDHMSSKFLGIARKYVNTFSVALLSKFGLIV